MSSAQIEAFGEFEGVAIDQVTLRSKAGAFAKILTWGAVVRDLVVPSNGGSQRVILGLNSIEDYQAHSPYFGAVPGRYANRIAGGRFNLDGTTYSVSRNERGVNCLHGGKQGFGMVPWTLTASTENSVTLSLLSPAGDQGFPGALRATCVYTLLEPATFRFELTAATEAPTVVNLTSHCYFNLDGSADILDHLLSISADKRTPTDDDLIPTGDIVPVAGTPFDFSKPRSIRNEAGQTYDDNFVLNSERGESGLRHAATAHSTKSGVTLQVFTNQPGLQFYNASKLNCPVAGLDGARYGRFGAFCLETQLFPDSPNKPQFPSSVLRPGGRYGNMTEFRFG